MSESRFLFIRGSFKIIIVQLSLRQLAWGSLIRCSNLCCICHPLSRLAYVVCCTTVRQEDWSTICYTNLKTCLGENSAKAPTGAESQVWYALKFMAAAFVICFYVWFDFFSEKKKLHLEMWKRFYLTCYGLLFERNLIIPFSYLSFLSLIMPTIWKTILELQFNWYVHWNLLRKTLKDDNQNLVWRQSNLYTHILGKVEAAVQ